MAFRCPRCRANDLVLETFGIYTCATCGRMDADGNDIVVPAPPVMIDTGRASFVAPPTGAVPILASAPVTGGPPQIFFAMVITEGLLLITSMLISGNPVRYFVRLFILGALLTGKRWAWVSSMIGVAFGMVSAGLQIASSPDPLTMRQTVLLAILALVDLVFLYSLLRPETARWFARDRPS